MTIKTRENLSFLWRKVRGSFSKSPFKSWYVSLWCGPVFAFLYLFTSLFTFVCDYVFTCLYVFVFCLFLSCLLGYFVIYHAVRAYVHLFQAQFLELVVFSSTLNFFDCTVLHISLLN